MGDKPQSASGTLLVGRSREVGEMVSALADVVGGRGRFFMLAGEPGVGKTRLLEELEERAASSRSQVAWGRGWEAGGAPPYWPWLQVAAALREGGDPGAAAVPPRLEDLLPKWPRAGPGMAGRGDSEEERLWFFDSVTRLLQRSAARQPIVILLDDLHVADASSLWLLRFVAGQRVPRLLLVAAYRDTDFGDDHELREPFAALARVGHTLPLRGLDDDAVSSLVAQVTACAPSSGLLRALQRRTGGNPFFLGEVLRSLLAEGRLEESAVEEEVPDRVRDAIRERLRRLSAASMDKLAVASLLGAEFEIEEITSVLGVSADAVRNSLRLAARRGILRKVTKTFAGLRFSHDLVREVLREEIDPATRSDLHRRIAEALEAAAPEREIHAAVLAHHWYEAIPSGGAAKAFD